MGEPEGGGLSRRRWIGQVATPALAASVAPGLVAAAEAATPAAVGSAGARVYDVRSFGAKGDGVTLDTAAVQAAVDAAHKDAGGVVLVPAGDFLVGTLELKSHVTLRLAAKGRLLGSASIDHYSPGKGIPRGNGNIVLLYAADAENVAIEGPGTVDGQGAKFYTGRGDMTGPGQDSSQGYFQRPHLAVFYRCRNLRLRDVFLTASAYHCVRILQCTDVHADGVRIHNRVNKNNDGFHFNSSEYVHIANCDVRCQDDACALFGSNKFVTITNSTFSTRWSVFRFGGGEPENIAVSNCVIYETYGCPIKIRMGRGSRMENVTFSNLILKDVTGPISIGLGAGTPRPGQSPTAQSERPPGIIRNLRFDGIRATVVSEGRQHADLPFKSEFRPGETRTCIVVNGAGGGLIEGIALRDVHVAFGGGGTTDEARREVPMMAGEYFEIGTPPAYGLYARNVQGLTLDNVRFTVATPDRRPAVVLKCVVDAVVSGLSAHGHPEAESVVRLTDSRDVLLGGCRVLTPAAAFALVEGAASVNVTIDGGDLSNAAKALVQGPSVAETAVRIRS
jgi:glycosyl hydrolase family 28